jgi:hypothetical protein
LTLILLIRYFISKNIIYNNIFVRSLVFLRWAEGPKANTEARPPDL